jgi:hypothetical protein
MAAPSKEQILMVAKRLKRVAEMAEQLPHGNTFATVMHRSSEALLWACGEEADNAPFARLIEGLESQ